MTTTLQRIVLFGLTIATLLMAACGRDDKTGTEGEEETLAPSTVDFLIFPNPQASVGVGDYSVVFSNSSLPASPATYTLTVVQTNGISQTFTGTWLSGDTVSQPIQVRRAGGITITLTSSGATADLSLRITGDSNNIATTSGVNPSIDLPKYAIDQAAYAQAYYSEIDPSNTRFTLAAFKLVNGFGSACAPNGTNEFEVRFRDIEDLGYGRHLCVRRDTITGNIAAWVENFQVTAIPGQNYGPLNLTAVINDDRQWHVGTNAIEFSPTPNSGTTKVTKFYTFNPDGTRRTLVDLDGRGAKAMPVPCISCHGGTALPLTASGLFPAIGLFPRADTLAHMQPLNVATLDFWATSPHTRADLEPSLKEINKIVLCNLPLPVGTSTPTGFTEDDCRSVSTLYSEWQGTSAEMIKYWYGGDGMPNATAGVTDTYVPTGWTTGVAGAQAQNLYQTVIAPYCRVCHIARGNANSPGADDIDFMSYDKLLGATGYTNRIKHHVFDKGNMPLAFLKFNQFWDSTAPDTLAAVIPGATSGLTTRRPNRPVAIPGPDRTLVTGVATKLSGAESINAVSYQWTVTSGNVGNTTLLNANTSRPTFTASVNDTYTIELIVSDGMADSDPATLTIATLATLTDGAGVVTVTDPAAIRFSDIRSILQDGGTYGCTGCHSSGSDGPPVFYDNYDRDGGGIGASDLHQFYLDVRARANLTDVASSRLLQRPSGHHHPGGLLANFDDTVVPGASGRGAYDIFLNWILNGAPE